MAICEDNRYTPRTCTAECANEATCNGNCGKLSIYVADLAINAETGQADFSNSVLILPKTYDPDKLRENMQQLLHMIIGFFEEEERKVESGELKEDDQQQGPYVQEIYPSTQSQTRSLPEAFNRRRA